MLFWDSNKSNSALALSSRAFFCLSHICLLAASTSSASFFLYLSIIASFISSVSSVSDKSAWRWIFNCSSFSSSSLSEPFLTDSSCSSMSFCLLAISFCSSSSDNFCNAIFFCSSKAYICLFMASCVLGVKSFSVVRRACRSFICLSYWCSITSLCFFRLSFTSFSNSSSIFRISSISFFLALISKPDFFPPLAGNVLLSVTGV